MVGEERAFVKGKVEGKVRRMEMGRGRDGEEDDDRGDDEEEGGKRENGGRGVKWGKMRGRMGKERNGGL